MFTSLWLFLFYFQPVLSMDHVEFERLIGAIIVTLLFLVFFVAIALSCHCGDGLAWVLVALLVVLLAIGIMLGFAANLMFLKLIFLM